MGQHGPIPKRSDKRLGHVGKPDVDAIDHAENELTDPLGPEPPEWLDGYAREMYEAFRISGQAIYYTHSDWATLTFICRHAMQCMRKPSAMLMASVMSGLTELGATEGARRRMRIELGKNAGTEDPNAERSQQLTDEWYLKLKQDNERRLSGLADSGDPDIEVD